MRDAVLHGMIEGTDGGAGGKDGLTMRLLHITDLYHPHNDPDDHFDLAQVFALAKRGKVDLRRIVVDLPVQASHGDPALCAVAQLNQLTGLDVPVTVGADPACFRGKPELWKDAPRQEVRGAERILETLEESREKTFISIAGGCLDTAVALARGPELFRERCAGILLNAGTGMDRPGVLEYNAGLGPLEYARIFRAPCPVYWSPCFHELPRRDEPFEMRQGEFGTYFPMPQGPVFNAVSSRALQYFLYMFSRSGDGAYLRYLERDPDAAMRERYAEKTRNMWCTASLFLPAGLEVSASGAVIQAGSGEAVYEYIPVQMECRDDGHVRWERCPGSDRLLFRVRDAGCYASAMSRAFTETVGIL